MSQDDQLMTEASAGEHRLRACAYERLDPGAPVGSLSGPSAFTSIPARAGTTVHLAASNRASMAATIHLSGSISAAPSSHSNCR